MGFKKWRSHFRVPPGLRIKTRLNAMPLIWNDIYRVFFILMQIKLISKERLCTWFLELGSGLFPIGKFRPGNQDFLFKRSVAPGNLPLKWPEKSCSIYQCRTLASLRGRRSKGKGKGIRARDRARGRRFLSFLPRASQALSRTQIPASPFNTCHAGYTLASIHNFNNLSSKDIFPSWGS